MIPNNNLSVLPWYTSIDQQNARKWWMYGKVYPLFTPAGFLLPWQLISTIAVNIGNIRPINLIDANTGRVVGDFTDAIRPHIQIKHFPSLLYDVIVFPGIFPVFAAINNGRYYLQMVVGNVSYYSEVFTVVNDIEPYLKITWWDVEDFVMDAGRIVYTEPNFKNVLYLQSDIAKPEYIFEEEGETRDGYFFPIKQISEKRYRFSFLASEYLLDVMRFIRMADFVEIEYHGQKYNPDTFLITPEWESNGDVAAVQAEFDTATVAKKIGRGYISPEDNGDFNDDFNGDYDNGVVTETWYIDRCIAANVLSPGATGLGWSVPNSYASVQGKNVNAIKLKVCIPGTYTIAVLSGNGTSVSVLAQRTIDFSNEVDGNIITRIFETINVPSNGYIAVSAPSDTGSAYFQRADVGTGQQGFRYKVGSADVTDASTWDLGVSFGYIN